MSFSEIVHPDFRLNGVPLEGSFDRFMRAVSRTFPQRQRDADFLADIEDFLRQYLDNTPTVVCHTSGSTGKPKDLPIEKSRMRASARMTCRYFGLEAGTRALLCLPIKYIAGRMMLVRALTRGWDLHAVTPSSRPLEHAPEGRFDFAAWVPVQLYESVGDIPRVRKILVGGGSVDKRFLDSLSGCDLPADTAIYQSYAMTETITHVAVRRLFPQAESVYTALEGVRFSLSAAESTLTVDAPAVAPRPVETRDVAELLDERHFIWRGRADTVINSGGIKLFPEDTEAILSGALPPGRYFVAGVPDARLGQRQVLFVEGKEGDFPHLEQYLAEHFDAYHRPKQTVFTTRFEQTATGKTDRRAVVARFSESSEPF